KTTWRGTACVDGSATAAVAPAEGDPAAAAGPAAWGAPNGQSRRSQRRRTGSRTLLNIPQAPQLLCDLLRDAPPRATASPLLDRSDLPEEKPPQRRSDGGSPVEEVDRFRAVRLHVVQLVLSLREMDVFPVKAGQGVLEPGLPLPVPVHPLCEKVAFG